MKKPKILLYDLEVSPCTGWFWSTGTQYVGAHQLLSAGKIICVAYRFLHWPEGKIKSLSWDSNQDDKNLTEKFIRIARTADFIVGHNGDNFDKKWLNARAAFHQLPTLSSTMTIDTYKMIKKEFRLPSMKLGYVCDYFNLGSKLSTDNTLWQDVTFKKCRKSLAKMVEYCENDVLILQKLYDRIFNYVKAPYNLSSFTDNDAACPRCGHDELMRSGYRFTKLGKFQRFICKSCAYDFRDGHNLNKRGKTLKR